MKAIFIIKFYIYQTLESYNHICQRLELVNIKKITKQRRIPKNPKKQ